jgi:hypothetical protein
MTTHIHRGTEAMASLTYDKRITALLVIDPYNDFISDAGKVWADQGRCRGKRLRTQHVGSPESGAGPIS